MKKRFNFIHKKCLLIFIATIISFSLLLLGYKHDLTQGISIALLAILTVAVVHKETKNKNLSKTLNAQKKLLSEVFYHCPDLIYYKDNNFNFLGANKAFIKLLGYESEQDIIGLNDFEVLPYELAQTIRNSEKKVLETLTPTSYEQEVTDPNGNKIIYETIKAPLILNNKTVGILSIARDINENKTLQKELQEQQSQLSSILDNLPSVVFLKDINSNVITGNKQYYKLKKMFDNKNDLTNEASLIKETPESKKTDEDVIKKQTASKTEKEVKDENQSRWYKIRKVPTYDISGSVNGLIEIISDISYEKEIQAQRETFIATLTHDLKTPTSAQIRALNLLINGDFGELAPNQKEIIVQTLNSCKYMLSMISTILSTYKNDSVSKDLEYQNFNIIELINECLTENSYLIEEKEQTIQTNFAPSSVIEINADKLEIKRVLMNLISNAAVYSRTNSQIDISISETENEISFFTKNASPYIPKEELEKLFDKYLSHSSKYRQVGTGLGLYLSKKIITQHKGTIFATSDEEGNAFGFTMPKGKDS